MQIWLIRDGEKHGPHPDYHIRQGIESGQYQADTPAWHDGLDAWTTLGEMSVFSSEFSRPEPTEDAESQSASAVDTPPPLPTGNLHLARRFWARVVDLQCYIATWWLFLYIAKFDIGAIFANPWIMLLQLLPWLPVEAALIHRHGSTPGKWLLGIHIHNDDGSPLTYRQAFWRSLRALVAGVGMGLGFLVPICLGLSYWITRRIGRPLWDHMGGHRATFTPIRSRRYIGVAAIIWLAMQLQTAVIAPHMVRLYSEQFPALREHFEKHPPFHFPDRHKAEDGK